MGSDLMLLPTARLVAPELQGEFGPIPPALIPLEGRPAFRHIGQATLASHGRLVLAAHESFDLLDEEVHRGGDEGITLINVGPTKSLGETLLQALRQVEASPAPIHNQRLVVSFADTFVADLPADGDIVSFRRQEDTQRWTTFSVTNGAIDTVTDKDVEKQADESLPIFVGVFAFTQPQLFTELLTDAVNNNSYELDPFYIALTAYSQRAVMTMHEVQAWYDFGHIDTYYTTRQRFFLNKRFFNAVEVDVTRGVIRKTSDDHQKLANEISWYQSLPATLKHLAPRILNHSLDATNVFVDMEFYGYPPLAEAYLHGAWNVGVWQQVTRALGQTIEMMQQHQSLVGRNCDSERHRLLEAMYCEKTLARTGAIEDSDLFGPLLNEEAVINGARCLGLDGFGELLETVLIKTNLLERDHLTVIHGDLCLSNILFDRRTSIVRLIDPRGSFGDGFSIYGDPLYDIAKLRHSFLGNYDHLVHGKFDLSTTETGVYMHPHLTRRQLALRPHFDKWLTTLAGPNQLRVRLIEALLFITMVPLHADKPQSQQAFLAQGLQLFTGVARQLGLWHLDRQAEFSELHPQYR
jgi:hypothetical protein